MPDTTEDPRSLILWGIASRPFPGHFESGDLCVIKSIVDGILVAVIDALGHGPEAASVASLVSEIIEAYASEPVSLLMDGCHRCLIGKRGAAISIAVLNGLTHTLTWLGVGNVEGSIVHIDAKSKPTSVGLLVRGGIVGAHLPALQPSVVTIEPGDLLIMS